MFDSESCPTGFDVIFTKDLDILMFDTREQCLNALLTTKYLVDHVMVGMHDHVRLVTGWEYVNMYT